MTQITKKEVPQITKKEVPQITKKEIPQITPKPSISSDSSSILAATVIAKPALKTAAAATPKIPAVGAVLQESRDEEVNNKFLRLTPEEAAEIEAAEVEEENDDEAPEQTQGGNKKKIIIAVVVAVVVVAVVVLLIKRRKRK